MQGRPPGDKRLVVRFSKVGLLVFPLSPVLPAVQAVLFGRTKHTPVPLRRACLEAALLLKRDLDHVFGIKRIFVHELMWPSVPGGGAICFAVCGGSGVCAGGFGHVRAVELLAQFDNVFDISVLL